MIFATPKPDELESEVIQEIESIREQLRLHLRQPRVWTGLLRRTAFAKNIRASNAIEGYNVSVDDALAATADEDPIDAGRTDWQAVWQYRQAMTYVIQLAEDPTFRYSAGLIKSLHYMMLSHDMDQDPGRWRRGGVFVYATQDEEVVYVGPDAGLVPSLIDELVEFLSRDNESHYLIRAAMAHLNLAMIHPFRDGNGRMARCLQTLVLAREWIVDPVFSSIEEYLGRNTDDYYQVLAEVGQASWNPGNDTKPWLRFCLTAHYRQATTQLRRVQLYETLWSRLERKLERAHLPERTILAAMDAAVGLRVRNGTYRKAAEVSNQVASRDLKLLADAGILRPVGANRGRYYIASDDVRSLARNTDAARKRVDDPFDLIQERKQLDLIEADL